MGPRHHRARRAGRTIGSALVAAALALGSGLVASASASASAFPDTAIDSGPSGTIASSSATFSFTSAADASFLCSLDGAPSRPCSSPISLVGLGDGAHAFSVAALVEGVEDPAPARALFTVDTHGPDGVAIRSPFPAFQRRLRFPIAWEASDELSGVASYDVLARAATGAEAPEPLSPWTSGAESESTFSGQPGRTYCFSVVATDGVGNVSTPSRVRCTATPIDDRSLRAGRGWIRGFGPGRFADTFVVSDRAGATLSSGRVRASRIALLATACPSCGSVEVRWNHTVLRRIDLSGAGDRPSVVFPVARFDGPRWGVLRIRVVSTGRRVEIDGVGILAT